MAFGNKDVFDDGYSDDLPMLGGFRRRRKKKSKRGSIRRGRSRRVRRSGRVRARRVRKSGRVKYTKNGQPYVLLRNGRAKFIKGRRHRKR